MAFRQRSRFRGDYLDEEKPRPNVGGRTYLFSERLEKFDSYMASTLVTNNSLRPDTFNNLWELKHEDSASIIVQGRQVYIVFSTIVAECSC